MAFSSPHPATPPPPLPPTPSPSPPLPHLHQHDTTLRLSLPAYDALASPNKPHAARRPRAQGGCSPPGDAPPCTECGRMFPSWKALFGHMRSHPERQWRGITPPPRFSHDTAAAASNFTAQELEVAASLLMLSGTRPVAAP